MLWSGRWKLATPSVKDTRGICLGPKPRKRSSSLICSIWKRLKAKSLTSKKTRSTRPCWTFKWGMTTAALFLTIKCEVSLTRHFWRIPHSRSSEKYIFAAVERVSTTTKTTTRAHFQVASGKRSVSKVSGGGQSGTFPGCKLKPNSVDFRTEDSTGQTQKSQRKIKYFPFAEGFYGQRLN